MDALDFLRGLDSDSIDCCVTSPPYDNLRDYNGYTWDFEGIAQELYRVIKPGGVVVWVVDDAMSDNGKGLNSHKQLIYFNEVVGFRNHQTIIWQKSSIPQKRSKAYLDDFEYMFVLSKGEPETFNEIRRKNKNYGQKKKQMHYGKKGKSYGKNFYTVQQDSIDYNVWLMMTGFNGATDALAFGHPALFPEELAERHIRTWTNTGDIVLDPFMGSGTVAKVARNLGRHYIGCDLSQDYVDLANQRLQNSDPYKATDLNNGLRQLSLFGDVMP